MSETIGKINFKFSKIINNQEVFLADEALAQKSNLGRLFVLLAIDSKERNLGEKIKDLVSLIENSYYSSPIADMESALELTCQEVNNNIQDIFAKPDQWYQKLNLLVGVVKNNNLVLSQMGAFSGYLVRHKKISQILSSKNASKEKKYFSQLITGEIYAEDGLILATFPFFDYFSLDKIKEVLINLKANQAVEHFKNLLLENSKNNNLIGIVIKENGQAEEIEIKESQTDKYIQEFYGSKESLKQLENLEQRTGRTLASSNWPDFLKLKRSLLTILKKPFSFLTKKPKELKLPAVEESLTHPKSGILKEKISRLNKFLKTILKNFFSNKKIFTVLIVVLIVIFLSSLWYLSFYKKKVDLLKNWQQTLDSAIEKKTASDTALIYEDKEKASNLLTEALNQLNNNYPTEVAWQTKFETEKKELTILLNKLNNIYEANLEVVSELGNLNAVTLKGLWKNKGNWQFLTANDEIYQLDNDKNATLVFKGTNLKQIETYKDNELVLLTNDNKFSYWKSGQESAKNLNISLTTETSANIFAIYNDNIYSLDSTSGSLNKISQILAAKPTVTNWYTGNKDLLKGAKELNIDGSVWLVNKNQIIKLFKGKEEAFELGKINQALGSNLELYTQTDWSSMYLLDQDNGRLLVINKENGAVLRQYLNNDLGQAKNLIVDDNQNNALITLENKIYKFSVK